MARPKRAAPAIMTDGLAITVRIPPTDPRATQPGLLERYQAFHAELAKTLPGCKEATTIRMLLQKGLDAVDAEQGR